MKLLQVNKITFEKSENLEKKNHANIVKLLQVNKRTSEKSENLEKKNHVIWNLVKILT